MKRQDKLLIAAILVTIAMLPMLPATLRAVDELSWEGVLPHIYSGSTGDGAINIAMTQSTVGLDVSEESTVTNTVYEIMSLTHTTSGTPANGIGEKITFTQETSSSNNEDVGYVGFSMSDVTAASEDASFIVGNMAAGAAAATKFTVGSTGIVSLAGAASLDNSTAATELNITETNIQLTGAIDMEGGDVKVNEDSGDFNFSIETDSTDNAFSIDSGNSTLETNGVTVTLNQGSADVDFVVESDNVADALKVDAGTDTVQFGSFISYEIATSSAQSYSIASAGKASVHIQTAGATASAHLMTDLLTAPGAGGIIILKTGDANDIVVDTEGAETINGGATYTIDGTQEAVTFITDGTNWHVISSYLE